MPPKAALSTTRRAFTAGLVAAPLTAGASARAATAGFREIEHRAGGRLGLVALDTGSGRQASYRAGERFLMCSTFKAVAVSALLARVDRGHERLDRRIAYGRKDILEYAPVTKAHLAEGGMTLDALCAAAIELSDNTAANLILADLGGPPAVTRFARALGDGITRLDRTETALNDPGPAGDLHDTTTPAAMVGLWRKLLLGDALSPASRGRLTGWLQACKTGPQRLMAITPAGWTIGHKTGSGPTTIGDVAILTPPGRPPILIAAYFEVPGARSNAHDEAIAQAGRLALSLIGSQAHG
jgi:beta-lactamase class A